MPLPLTASATAAVVLVVSFSNLTDMASEVYATVAGGGEGCLEVRSAVAGGSGEMGARQAALFTPAAVVPAFGRVAADWASAAIRPFLARFGG